MNPVRYDSLPSLDQTRFYPIPPEHVHRSGERYICIRRGLEWFEKRKTSILMHDKNLKFPCGSAIEI
jgi:hypothetical protein